MVYYEIFVTLPGQSFGPDIVSLLGPEFSFDVFKKHILLVLEKVNAAQVASFWQFFWHSSTEETEMPMPTLLPLILTLSSKQSEWNVEKTRSKYILSGVRITEKHVWILIAILLWTYPEPIVQWPWPTQELLAYGSSSLIFYFWIELKWNVIYALEFCFNYDSSDVLYK